MQQTLRKDSSGTIVQDSSGEQAFRGQYDANNNLIYAGFAPLGSDTANEVWQIRFMTYDGNNNLTAIEWPIDANSRATNRYEFAWDNRAAETYQ